MNAFLLKPFAQHTPFVFCNVNTITLLAYIVFKEMFSIFTGEIVNIKQCIYKLINFLSVA